MVPQFIAFKLSVEVCETLLLYLRLSCALFSALTFVFPSLEACFSLPLQVLQSHSRQVLQSRRSRQLFLLK